MKYLALAAASLLANTVPAVNATPTPTLSAPAEVDYYTCPMHADVREKKPGKCPKCGMELVPVYKKK
jgi:hypothetical protein